MKRPLYKKGDWIVSGDHAVPIAYQGRVGRVQRVGEIAGEVRYVMDSCSPMWFFESEIDPFLSAVEEIRNGD